MGTFSKVYIETDKIKTIKKLVGNYYEIIKEEIGNDEQDWKFSQNGNDTIILAKNCHQKWVEMSLNFTFSMYFHDELLRRISKKLQTTILLGYYQSTCGAGRLAKFKNGELHISIVQREVQSKAGTKMLLVDNWGVTDELRREFLIPKLKEEYYEIDVDMIYKFYKTNDLEWNGLIVQKETYHHLEVKF